MCLTICYCSYAQWWLSSAWLTYSNESVMYNSLQKLELVGASLIQFTSYMLLTWLSFLRLQPHYILQSYILSLLTVSQLFIKYHSCHLREDDFLFILIPSQGFFFFFCASALSALACSSGAYIWSWDTVKLFWIEVKWYIMKMLRQNSGQHHNRSSLPVLICVNLL